MKNLYSKFAAIILAFAATFGVTAVPAAAQSGRESRAEAGSRVRAPLNFAVLIQDDLVSRVGNEIKTTAEFIRELPEGSQVMVGYIRAGSLQVRQPFTADLERAAKALRVPVGSTAVSPYNPYVEVREALKLFPEAGTNRNALLLISDGLDASRGFDFASSVTSVDLDRAVREAKKREVAVYAFYAPSAGLTSWNHRAINLGQSALNRISDRTGGRAFFQGNGFVTFDAYFKRLSKAINEREGAY
ncbi:MAG TPA: hypothetical protein VG148_15170 [Pyrinomonadaceae bacterium]|nr:hypothetical protein [Pyrinomonadaceae bacterium]